MAEITAAAVMKLRKISGQGMMDCKKALEDSKGDVEEALIILRKKGLATLAKRAERETSEGIVVFKVSDDGKKAVMATLCCETDFVAKSDDFIAAAGALSEYAMQCTECKGATSVMETKIGGKAFNEIVTETVSKTGEKTEVGDYARFELKQAGIISSYVHFNKKNGAMLVIETDSDKTANSDAIKKAGSDIAMHITATKPLSLNKDGIDPAVIEKERAIARDQVKNKPENIIEKIVDGKLNKFFSDNCLVSQPFVKDDKKTVEQVVTEAAKAAGGTAKITAFVRMDVS
ncbi:MAG: translation elongation factor Ts [Phycisphaerae bacterium]|nr:translation elongation factor Ts [Phycisphaerae bacterium]